jgi:hypothetical protein
MRGVIYVTDLGDGLGWNGSMPEPRRYALRIVVQQLGEPERYRLIAYSDAAVYRPLEFTSRAAIVSALRHLVADADENLLPAPEEAVRSRIVYTADVEVAELQLRDAGLTR